MDLLRDERLRPFALDIETDSTIQPDEDAAEAAQHGDAADRRRRAAATGGRWSRCFPGRRNSPATCCGRASKPFRIGRDLSSSLDKMIEAPSRRPQGDKPPSPEEIKAQAEAQKLMAEMAMKAEEAKAKAATEERKMMADRMMQKAKIEADREKMLGEMQIKERESQQKMLLEQQKHQQDMQKAQVEFAKMQKEMEATDAEDRRRPRGPGSAAPGPRAGLQLQGAREQPPDGAGGALGEPQEP